MVVKNVAIHILCKYATQQNPLTSHENTESFFKAKSGGRLSGVKSQPGTGEVKLSQDRAEKLGDISPVLLYDTNGKKPDHMQTWRDVGEVSVTHKQAKAEKNEVMDHLVASIEKNAFFGFGRGRKKSPMLKRPKGLGRGSSRRAQQMRNIEDEYVRKGAFHPAGPVTQNRAPVGSGNAAIASGKQSIQDWKDTGQNPDVTMQYKQDGQMQGTYPSLSGETASYTPAPAPPAADIGSDYMANTGQFAPEAQHMPSAPAPVAQAPVAPPTPPTPAPVAQAPAPAAKPLRGPSNGAAQEYARNFHANIVPKGGRTLSKPQRFGPPAGGQQKPEYAAARRADGMRQAVTSAGYGQATTDKINKYMTKNYGAGPSAAKQAAMQKVMAHVRANPRKAQMVAG